MRKAQNNEYIEGRIYQHDLAIKTVQNKESANYGKEYIAGNVEVATDEEGLNVIKVHFSYVTEANKSGNKNVTFANLKKIIDEGKTWVAVGKDNAAKVRINTALALNDFYNANDELVSAKVNEGGFVSFINELKDEKERNTFSVDMVITAITHVDVDEEKQIKEEYTSVKGAIFDFRNAILPVEFKVKNKDGMNYFENLQVSNAEPIYTKVWGQIVSETTTVQTEVESAFGEPAVRSYTNTHKDWVITGTAKVPYDFGDSEVLTMEDLQKASQERQVYLATVKQRAEEYKAQKAAGNTATQPTATATKQGNFVF